MISLNNFSLSLSNFKDINLDIMPNDFYFIINDVIYSTNKVIASFLSPKIHQQINKDPTFSFFIIHSKLYGNFNEILELGSLKSIKIDESNIDYILNIFQDLENNEISDFISANENIISTEDAFDRILAKSKTSYFGDANINREIQYIASHFYEFNDNDSSIDFLEKFGINNLSLILTNEDLCVSNEDSLFSIILALSNRDLKYYEALSYVEFNSLSEDCFINFIQMLDINLLNQSIWRSLLKRIGLRKEEILKLNSNITMNSSRYRTHETIETFENNEKYGIIAHISQLCQGNPHTKNEIIVTSSSVYFDHLPENCLDFDKDTYFASEDHSSQWIMFDFKQREIILTAYAIRSQYDYINNLKSWIIEVSKDNVNWTQIDRKVSNEELKESNSVAKFNVNNRIRCRFIRLKQIGCNWNLNEYLIISGIEFFGKLISK